MGICNRVSVVGGAGGELLKVLARERCIVVVVFALICSLVAGCASGTLTANNNGPTPTPTPNGNPTPSPTPTGSPTPPAHSVALSWSASSSSGVASYNVYRSGASTGPFARIGNVMGTSYTDATVAGGQTYFYTVTSVNTNNVESAAPPSISATVP